MTNSTGNHLKRAAAARDCSSWEFQVSSMKLNSKKPFILLMFPTARPFALDVDSFSAEAWRYGFHIPGMAIPSFTT